MATKELQPYRWFNTLLWGNTVTLSWMWGLGLFFSVQFTTQFGLAGLLSFAIPNCLGLVAFGLITNHLARRQAGGSESLGRFFTAWSRPFRLIFFLYQLIAITLTIFALIRYGWMPLGLEPQILFLPLILLVVLAAGILFGEEFNIRRIKWSHGVIFLILLGAIGFLLAAPSAISPALPAITVEKLPTNDWNYWGYMIPIFIGFLLGPWLDLQQWQRAIQMHREQVSIATAYFLGAVQFFLLLLFHGYLALWALGAGAGQYLRTGLGGHVYGHDSIMRLLFEKAGEHPWIFGAYCVFLCACVLTTLDSGYIALRWFLQSNVRASVHAIFALIPTSLVTSPIPIFLFCGAVALVGAAVGLELEYFMIFFATFFVGYSALGVARCYINTPANRIPQIKMFCLGSLAVVIFAFGYLLGYPAFMIIGSLLPLGYVIWTLAKPTASEDFVSDADQLDGPAGEMSFLTAPVMPAAGSTPAQHSAPTLAGAAAAITDAAKSLVGAVQHPLGGHFEGKWFIHSFVATYADTNSVGNVYFGMYAMWVGKTRELFFNRVMPKFNLKETPFYILTRSFEHKFVRETREFETVSVRIRISGYNRKFVTLAHEIYDSQNHLLGKGQQSLLFVSSTDYKMIDVPPDVHAAFIPYV
ncbi:MAG: thioesterase family protein, partial [Chthoniobacterales bacterium]